MNKKLKAAISVAFFAFVLAIVAPMGADAATNVKVKYNGKSSMNMVMVKKSSKTMVMQKNMSMVSNNVGVMQNTGGNKANNNTGSEVVMITTGNTSANVSSYNVTGGNYAIVDDCGCEPNETNIVVKNNGANTKNIVHVSEYDKTYMTQMNMAWVSNNVEVAQNTGMNSASGNTAGSENGDPSIHTGNSSVTIVNETYTGDNVLGPAIAE
jgi:hypothetical protein